MVIASFPGERRQGRQEGLPFAPTIFSEKCKFIVMTPDPH